MSFGTYEYEMEVKRKLADGWIWKLLRNGRVILAPPPPETPPMGMPSSMSRGTPSVRKGEGIRPREKEEEARIRRTDRNIEERIAEAERRNRMLLPSYIPQKENGTADLNLSDTDTVDGKDSDLVKLATHEDIECINKRLNKINVRLQNIEELLLSLSDTLMVRKKHKKGR